MKPPTPKHPLLAALRANSPRLTDYPKLALVGSAEQPEISGDGLLTLGSVIELLSIINELKIGVRNAHIMTLLHRQSMKPTDLAEETSSSTATITSSVTRLRMLGMVTSERVESDDRDRREVYINLTAAGRNVVRHIIAMIQLFQAARYISATREVTPI